MMNFSVFLKNLRARAGLTQKDLSLKIGVTKQTLSGWETHRFFPSNTLLRKIARLFRVPLAEMMKIKAQHKRKQQEELILKSKDPVVSALDANYAPLLDKKTQSLPLEEIRNPARWKGRRFSLPADFFPGSLFGFEIGDSAMEPDYRAGDIVLANIRGKAEDGQPVIVKIKGRPPMCRVHFDGSIAKVFITAGAKKPAEKILQARVEWCYPVVRRLNPKPD